jgi:hypothetical protein
MSKRESKSLYLVVLTTSLILSPLCAYSQNDAHRTNGGAQSQIRAIPFSVTAGVPVGGALIRAFTLPSFPPPFNDDPKLFVPAVFLPPQTDSFVVQTVADLSGLESANRLNVDLFFSVVKEDGILFSPGRIRLFVSLVIARDNLLVSGRSLMKDQVIDLTVESPLKATFSFPIGSRFEENDYIIIQIGRHANQTTEDTNPGTVRLHAIRITAVRV